ncbi:MAG TPA: c-type cytochrome domain-containing protein, partial [Planctomycetota bacterium]|nr:c-type cytochrome domain-containing protein [Planctomycetota bacterium]
MLVLRLGSAHAQDAAEPRDLEFFEKKIRPLLTERCYSCHSAKAEKLKGGLYLDSREGIRKGGDTGPALEVVGDRG